MANYTFCTYKKCSKSTECKRFMIRESNNPQEIDFRNLCNEKNNYYLKIEMDKIKTEPNSLVKKEDV